MFRNSLNFLRHASTSSFFASSAFRLAAVPRKPNYALTALGISSVSAGYLLSHSKIYNDTFATSSPSAGQVSNDAIKVVNSTLDDVARKTTGPRYDGAFDGRLNYRQVALGSTLGLAIGFCLSRLSSILFILVIGGYSLSVYLKKQGIQFVNTKGMVKGAVDQVDWEDVVFNQISFSLPFLTSFIMSATL